MGVSSTNSVCRHIASKLFVCEDKVIAPLLSLTQENAADLHSVGRVRNTRYNSRGKTYRSCKKHASLSLHDLLATAHHLLFVSFITNLKWNLCTALTTQNITEQKCIHAEKESAVQSNVFLTGIHGLLVKRKERSALHNANNCQGQQRTFFQYR
jgi:hypothetical protein